MIERYGYRINSMNLNDNKCARNVNLIKHAQAPTKIFGQFTMSSKLNISTRKQIWIIYIVLTLTILAVFGQVAHYDFINFDDPSYVTQNTNIQKGLTLNGLRWAFSTIHTGYWHPLTWLSLMFNIQFCGLNAGGYHLTNLILHILNTLLLFWFLNRCTGSVWKSAFVAAFFSMHPLHVESVAWIAERKDVLAAFFWMLTLCLYVHYTGKPVMKKYFAVLLSFVFALMSKPMVVTLPFVLLLLDYWPLERWQKAVSSSVKDNVYSAGKLIAEKIPFIFLSIAASIATLYAQSEGGIVASVEHLSFCKRFTNTVTAYVFYLEKIFWPVDLAVLYPYNFHLSFTRVIISGIVLMVITIFILYYLKKRPFLFVGWFWYLGVLVPVIGLVQVGSQAMADRYTYLSSIGIAIMLAWGFPFFLPRKILRKNLLLLTAIVILCILSALTWRQCSYWRNSTKLWQHTLMVTKNNDVAHRYLGIALFAEGKTADAIENYKKAILINPYDPLPYNNIGIAYASLGLYQSAILNFSEVIRIDRNYVIAFNNRGSCYAKLGLHQKAIEDYSEAIRLKPDYTEAYNNRAFLYFSQGDKISGCIDVKKACSMGNCKALYVTQNNDSCR